MFRSILLSSALLLVTTNTSLLAGEKSTTMVCDYSGCQKMQLKLEKEALVTGFSTSQVWEVVEDILQVSGLAPNFEVTASTRVSNAAALIRDDQRYLAYNKRWMAGLKGDNMTSWRLYAVMAHEIGHHLQGHTLESGGSHPKTELEADNYAGFILAGLGGSLEEALVLWKGLSKSGSRTHPARKDRLQAVTVGWQRWHKLIANVSKGTIRQPKKEEQPRASSSDFIIATSDQMLVVEDDLAGFKPSEIRLARNEIFARHGYVFNSADLKQYFSQYNWYQPVGKNVALSALEKANVSFLLVAERQRKKRSSVTAKTSKKRGYLYPGSNTRLLTTSELKPYSRQQLRLFRNEIFARHGYVFKSADLNQYFRDQPWYVAKGKTVSLSTIEQANIALIKRVENE